MYVTCFVFLMLWLGYAWAWTAQPPEPAQQQQQQQPIRVTEPILKRHCGSAQQPVACIDTCSFLCIESAARCIGGVCQPDMSTPDIACSEKTGGVKVMVKDPVPHWACICSDSRFYGGDACDQQHPDVCEHGKFTYFGRARYVCICSPPYELIKIQSKPYCVDKKMMGFYDETTMSKSIF